MSNDIKIVYISNFSQFQSSRGHQISVFSKVQNSSNYPRGGELWTCISACIFSSILFKFSHWLNYSPLAVALIQDIVARNARDC